MIVSKTNRIKQRKAYLKIILDLPKIKIIEVD